jgi:F-type H+-transporting ATPase subunit epsilon
VAAQIQLEIVTPEGVKFSQKVDEFTAPSVEGQFGVLASHRPLLAGLKTGIVSYRVGNESAQVAVGPGFAKVADDQASLIVENFIAKDDVDAVIARKDLKEAQAKLDKLSSDAPEHEVGVLISASRWAAARLELYGDPPPPTILLAQEMRLLARADYRAISDEEEGAEEEVAHGSAQKQ